MKDEYDELREDVTDEIIAIEGREDAGINR